MSNRINSPAFSNDQRTMLEFYLTAYNDIRGDIDRLYESLDNVVSRINTLSRNVETQRADNNTNRTGWTASNLRSNTSRHRTATRTADSILSDYLYNDLAMPRFSRNEILRNEIPRAQPQARQNTNAWTRNNTQLVDFLSQFYNNVPVVPTRQQIDAATRRILYREIEAPLNSSCPICLDRFQPDDSVMQIIRCGHIFNEDSINLWFRANVRCPVCRHDIREPHAVATTQAATPASTQNQSSRSTATAENSYYEYNSESDDEEDVETQNNPTNSIPDASFNETTANPSPETNQSEIPPVAQNLRVERDPVTNSIDRISYDLTDENLINNITNIAGDLLFGNRSTPLQYNNGNQRFVYDPSSNIVMFETYFQRQP
jgi:hypothetical protein